MDDFARLMEKARLSARDVAAKARCSEKTAYRWRRGQNQASPARKLMIDWMRDIVGDADGGSAGTTRFTFIDLFAGIGGMRKGFEAVGGKCVYTSEWDKFSRETYAANFDMDPDDHPFMGDITQDEAKAEITSHDVLLAGFPCQPFSIAGVSKKRALGQPTGFECETQGTLFFHVCKILRAHKPPAFLLENVKNLKSHDGGNTFRVICDSLAEIGYVFEHRVIDAQSFVPQHRERIFIAGFRADTGFSFDDLRIPDTCDGPKLGTILHPEDGSEDADGRYTEGGKGRVAAKYTLTAHLWNYLQDYAKKHRAKGNGFGFGRFGRDDVARTLSARYYKDGSEILISQKKKRPRRLTPRECSRLMGFDVRRQSDFRIPVSDTQAYKQFGNSVAVPVVQAVAEHMLPHIERAILLGRTHQLELPIPSPSVRSNSGLAASV